LLKAWDASFIFSWIVILIINKNPKVD